MNSQQQRVEAAGLFHGNTLDGTFTSAGFFFTEPQIHTVITNYLDLADSYDDSVTDARAMVMVEGPGRDFASDSFAFAARRSGHALVDSLMDARDYCLTQAQLCQNALDDYLGIEHRNVTRLTEQGQSGPQPGV
jgi:hypothetical protein